MPELPEVETVRKGLGYVSRQKVEMSSAYPDPELCVPQSSKRGGTARHLAAVHCSGAHTLAGSSALGCMRHRVRKVVESSALW